MIPYSVLFSQHVGSSPLGYFRSSFKEGILIDSKLFRGLMDDVVDVVWWLVFRGAGVFNPCRGSVRIDSFGEGGICSVIVSNNIACTLG